MDGRGVRVDGRGVRVDGRVDGRAYGRPCDVHLCAALSMYRNNQVQIPGYQVKYLSSRYKYLVISVRA